jgi:transcriptional regulator with XRE-family HTH domain
MSTIDDAKKTLGLRLREIRKDARLTGRQLAALASWHYTKVSKVEHGVTMPSEADLEAWTFHCMAQSELPDLIATAREIEKAYAELRRLHRAGTAQYQRELLKRVAKGRRFRVFTVNLVPAAFQTASYASTVLGDAAEMLGHPADIGPTVEARLARARLFRSEGRLYHAVTLQNVLNAAVVPNEVMTEQLRHMLDLQQAPSLRLGIVPVGTRRYMPMCEFNITDDTEVRVETFSAIVRVTQPREIAVYAKVFDHYARRAVYGSAAAEMIRRALDELEQQGATC